jgi:hypothetical protein
MTLVKVLLRLVGFMRQDPGVAGGIFALRERVGVQVFQKVQELFVQTI